MRLFTNKSVVALLLLFIGGCADTGPKRPDSRAAGDRSPVPISASERSDFNKAIGLMKKGEYQEALPLLEGIVKASDGLPGVNINLAITYMKLVADDNYQEYYEKAEKALLGATEAAPENAVAQFQLGLLYRQTGRFDLSRKSYEQAIRIKRDYAMAHYNLGILCDIYMQQLKCAIEYFENYLQLVPEDSEKVGKWLSDLRRRAGIPEPAAPVAAVKQEGS